MRTKISFSLAAFVLLLFGPGPRCEAQTEVKIVTDPERQVVKKAIPEYPENLIDSEAEGRVALLFTVKENGKVKSVSLGQSIHPVLDKLAVDALKKWEFKPLDLGPMSVSPGLAFFYFYPNAPNANTPDLTAFEPENEELRTVLDRCAEYCNRLSALATFFVCHERVAETIKSIHLNEYDFTWGETGRIADIWPALGGGQHSRHLYDYQLINVDGRTQERRMRLDSRGREVPEDKILPDNTRPSSIKAILIPGRLLGRDQRTRFFYKMAEGGEVKGRAAHLIEVRPRVRLDGGIIRAKVWLDKEACRVLKAEVETATLSGYDEMTKECSEHHLRAHFKAIHFYEFERNGILFPSHSELLVEYTGLPIVKKDIKAKAEIDYEKYAFFSTAWDYLFKGIKKKPLFLMPTLPGQTSGFIFWR